MGIKYKGVLKKYLPDLLPKLQSGILRLTFLSKVSLIDYYKEMLKSFTLLKIENLELLGSMVHFQVSYSYYYALGGDEKTLTWTTFPKTHQMTKHWIFI